ncbi:hypothetical protein D8674_008391 [Pyrus ussuriensis x Pyrus communis]|uniref:Uncharacterized protein n=1 Tax=Pyrus ussuriensis x Pyrus communis TaxID=2448454 RepID=A0A5N5HXG8_9ROSA|nr:hypothetical protein D8674_008391 [Pyrus ussuriensis x Pyrus communis]
MIDSGGPSSKRVQGEDKRKKRAATCVQYTSSAKNRYRITYVELVGYEKLDMVNKFRADVGVLVCERCREIKIVLIDALAPDWDIDKSDANLMKCIDVVFKYRFRELNFDVERDAEQHRVAGPVDD